MIDHLTGKEAIEPVREKMDKNKKGHTGRTIGKITSQNWYDEVTTVATKLCSMPLESPPALPEIVTGHSP